MVIFWPFRRLFFSLPPVLNRKTSLSNSPQKQQEMKSINGAMKTLVLTALGFFLVLAGNSQNGINQVHMDGLASGMRGQLSAVRKGGIPVADGYATFMGSPHQTGGFPEDSPLQNNVDILWQNHFGGAGKNECYMTQQTSDGGYILIGRSDIQGTGNYDAWLVKTDANGQKVWDKTYGGSYIDEAYAVKELSGGGYIIAGMTTAYGNAGEGWLIRTDASGNEVWEHAYHPATGSAASAWEYLYDVVEMADGSFITVGTTADDTYSIQAWILKVSSNGDVIWEHKYGDIYWERFFCMDKTSDGAVVAVGDRHVTFDSLTWKHDGWLVKFDVNGDTTWTRHFGGPDHDIFRSVKQTTDGGYIIAGEREINASNGFFGWLVRTDASGNEIFNKTLAHGGLYSVVQANDGKFVVAGIYSAQGSTCDGWLLKAGASGEILWENILNGSDMDDMYLSIGKTTDNGYITGGKFNTDMTSGDYWLVKSSAEHQVPLTYFFENFDSVATPALPDGWSALVRAMLSNTVAEVKTMANGTAPTQPNACFIMNGLDGSSGQKDTTVFLALISPWVMVTSTGATLTFRATGGNPVQVGTISDPTDPATFRMVEELPLPYDFTGRTVSFMTPGTTYLAIKNANANAVTPVFVDNALFQQIGSAGTGQTPDNSVRVYPNPCRGKLFVESREPAETVRIYSITGVCISETACQGSKRAEINLPELAAGTYILTVTTANGSKMTRKICVMP